MPKVSILAVIWAIHSVSGSEWNTVFRIKYQIVRSRSPSPTTVKPITEPAEKATLRPLFRLREAPSAVLQFAIVAVRIPIKPDKPEKKPPVKNANGVK